VIDHRRIEPEALQLPGDVLPDLGEDLPYEEGTERLAYGTKGQDVIGKPLK
jgi:hypothetical protein